jgi:DNA polymerase-3 subunit epsilon
MLLQNLALQRPLVFFDIESTGTDVSKDRIVELCLIKYHPDHSSESKTMRFNPGMPIPKETSDIHGITDEMVKDAPSFASKAEEIAAFLSNCDLGGYNILRFDVPMISEELSRSGIKEPIKADVKFVDSFRIFSKMEKRDLSAALKFYCQKEIVNAHSAEADTIASAEVLNGQIAMYGLKADAASLHDFCSDGEILDYDRRFGRNEKGDIIFNFGTNKGKRALDNPGMLQWMMDKDFSENTKMIAGKILRGELK